MTKRKAKNAVDRTDSYDTDSQVLLKRTQQLYDQKYLDKNEKSRHNGTYD